MGKVHFGCAEAKAVVKLVERLVDAVCEDEIIAKHVPCEEAKSALATVERIVEAVCQGG